MSLERVTLTSHLVFLSLTLMLFVASSLTISTSENESNDNFTKNWQDEIVINELSERRDKIILEREILKLLGIPEKPNIANSKDPLMRIRSAPNFLLKIYENSIQNDEPNKRKNISPKNEDFYLSIADLQTINNSDYIVTFSAQRKHSVGNGETTKPDKVKRIWFDVSAAPRDERMIAAELRLYRGVDAKNNKHRGIFRITVYRVLRSDNEQREMLLVDSINTTEGQVAWLTLNVTESLSHWMKNSSSNRGLYLSVNPIDRLNHETRPEDIGIVGFKGDAKRQPFMAGFFASKKLGQLRINDYRPKLEDIVNNEDKSYEERYRRRDMWENSFSSKILYAGENDDFSYSTRPCALNNWYLSFKELEWQNWIIAPDGYDANYCFGECKFPLRDRMNATNHATIQTLMHLKHPSEVPKACCTPTGYTTISVLYFHDDNNVVLRKYRNMSVRGCGCH